MLRRSTLSRRTVLSMLAGSPWVGMGAAVETALAASIPPALESDEGFPYRGFDAVPPEHLQAEGADFAIVIATSDFALGKDDFRDWIKHAAKAVATYYGKFPVPTMRLLFMPTEGTAVRGGTTWGYQGVASRINIGTATTRETCFDDWVLVHEMIHTALPDLSRDHLWLAEGIAVYVESICRVQAGHLKEAQIWGDFVRAMPKGQPKEGDRGFDFTHSWGRTYWGGATFCLLADLELRKRSSNTVGLQQALRAVNAVANHSEDMDIRKILAIADKATGYEVLTSMYEDMRAKPVPTDFDKLWSDLGVKPEGNTVSLADAAPMAALRKAIVAPLG